MTDLFTKYAWAVPTVDQTAVTTANALWRAVIQPFGCPETLHSNQGSNFESRVIQELSRLYGCRKTHTTSYHPQGNGGCERFNQTLLGLLGTLESEQQGQWAESLPSLLQAYNNSVHSVTGYAPSYLMFGRHLRLPVDLLMGTEATERGYSTTDWVNRHHHQLLNAYRRVSDHLSAAAAKNKRLYDRTAREAPLLPGERVLVRDNRRPGKGKLSDRWESTPYVVEQRQGPDAPVYSVRPEGKPGPIRVLHRNLLRPCPNYPQLVAEAPSAPPASEAPMVGWAVVPRLRPERLRPRHPDDLNGTPEDNHLRGTANGIEGRRFQGLEPIGKGGCHGCEREAALTRASCFNSHDIKGAFRECLERVRWVYSVSRVQRVDSGQCWIQASSEKSLGCGDRPFEFAGSE
ncbi:interleukin-1 receptor accessory protein-like 1-A [Pimephales promelas]|nr:interleukin-1 receptor accessory protein-like 1-A [Pimephales promelas]